MKTAITAALAIAGYRLAARWLAAPSQQERMLRERLNAILEALAEQSADIGNINDEIRWHIGDSDSHTCAGEEHELIATVESIEHELAEMNYWKADRYHSHPAAAPSIHVVKTST